jgi:hypothetical protein
MQAGVSAEEFEHTIADPELLMEVRRCCAPANTCIPVACMHCMHVDVVFVCSTSCLMPRLSAAAASIAQQLSFLPVPAYVPLCQCILECCIAASLWSSLS